MATKKPVESYEMKITLMHIAPLIWRRVLVPKDVTLGTLHHVIQRVMDWEDAHLHEFQIGTKRYGLGESNESGFAEDDESIDEDTMRLSEVAKPNAKFTYHYDFGDDWIHEIHIERETEAQAGKRRASCIAGARACPPDDCGGPPGYARMLRILRNPKHEEYEEMLEWVEDDFDPKRFDQESAERRLSKLKV